MGTQHAVRPCPGGPLRTLQRDPGLYCGPLGRGLGGRRKAAVRTPWVPRARPTAAGVAHGPQTFIGLRMTYFSTWGSCTKLSSPYHSQQSDCSCTHWSPSMKMTIYGRKSQSHRAVQHLGTVGLCTPPLVMQAQLAQQSALRWVTCCAYSLMVVST